METNIIKKNVLKKILNHRMMVITDHVKNEYYIGQIESIVDAYNVIVRNNVTLEKVSIFDLRSIPKKY
jgi:small nuclear ribonucleoprotein (snRNP)-like protein